MKVKVYCAKCNIDISKPLNILSDKSLINKNDRNEDLFASGFYIDGDSDIGNI